MISGKHNLMISLLAALGVLLASLIMAAGATAQDDEKPTVAVGSQNYTEQIILSEMLVLLLEDAGYPVERNMMLGGTAVTHQALLADEIDMYVEYTGSGLFAILGEDLPDDQNATPAATPVAGASADPVYQYVKSRYAEEFGLTWLEPWGVNNTYTITVSSETANDLGLQAISDLQGHAEDMTLGSDQEFPSRPDGLPGLEDAYDLSFADVVILDVGLMYSAVAEGQVDAITGYSTDGRIPALDLVILEDDRGFFPPYHAAPVVRSEPLEESPEIVDVLNQLGGNIDNEAMAEMNYVVDNGGEEPVDVARAFLIEQGLIEGEG